VLSKFQKFSPIGEFMELYTFILVVLFGTAIADLIVGVSNDAVNFLNSAVGSKAASRRVIMIVAGVGVLFGTTFSSGMMEIARKGIFNPEYYVLHEVIIILLACRLRQRSRLFLKFLVVLLQLLQ
jgi:phosphate/sulfate permease